MIDGDALPLTLDADGLRGGEVAVDASVSSQFLSGLLMAAPLARGVTRLRFGALVSRPICELTLDVMRAFGRGGRPGMRVSRRARRATGPAEWRSSRTRRRRPTSSPARR